MHAADTMGATETPVAGANKLGISVRLGRRLGDAMALGSNVPVYGTDEDTHATKPRSPTVSSVVNTILMIDVSLSNIGETSCPLNDLTGRPPGAVSAPA
jgi:hypothetical protein